MLIKPSTCTLLSRSARARPLLPTSKRLQRPICWTPIRYHAGHQHHHSHDHDLASTLKSSGKKGIQITLVGLVANVGLTISKGVAGWYMNSASLLADATHSLSDLLSDFVTLYTFKMSRKEPDHIYPYGYGKYETIGSLGVSTLLIGGGVAIGFHSFDLLTAALDAMSNAPTIEGVVSVTSTASENKETASTLASLMHHHHHDSTTLDPNAAWFALASVVVKEWLYRATLKVGKSEHSNVLIANAWHHRSDALSSVIALVAIGGSYAGLPILDPLGGMLVSGLIVKSGYDIMVSSLQELLDKGVSQEEINQVIQVIAKVKQEEPHLIDYYYVRGRIAGPYQHLDMILQLDPKLPVEQAHRIEQRVRATIKHECPMVQEVLIHLDAEKQPPHF
ncbi:cation efflux protein [Hesseltinella vesiculosa]|uniref:Cation efflux protein n=1 Tax=Hesseltinella vesiculosa TaxID=101127 RepID=A0A1X2GLL5_9FUNG|nr:cation efflux protein [Hesseltinella vesiculosa]